MDCRITRLLALNVPDKDEGKGKLKSLYNTSRVSWLGACIVDGWSRSGHFTAL